MSVFSIVALSLLAVICIELLLGVTFKVKPGKLFNTGWIIAAIATLVVGVGVNVGLILGFNTTEVYTDEEYDITKLCEDFSMSGSKLTKDEHRMIKHVMNRYTDADKWIIYNPETYGQEIMNNYSLSAQQEQNSGDLGGMDMLGMLGGMGGEEVASEENTDAVVADIPDDVMADEVADDAPVEADSDDTDSTAVAENNDGVEEPAEGMVKDSEVVE